MRRYPVAYFLESALANLDPARTKLVAYVTQPSQDEFSTRLKQHFSGWHSLEGMSDMAAARKIHDDKVHLLVDLSGHTGGGRLPVFSWRPAPLQISWLGSFATTGLPEMDYFLADETGVPPDHRTLFTENIWYLPETRLCFTPPDTLHTPSMLPALTKKQITFASFQAWTVTSSPSSHVSSFLS